MKNQIPSFHETRPQRNRNSLPKEDPRADAKKSVACKYLPHPVLRRDRLTENKSACTFVLNIETSSQKSPPYTGIHIQYWHISRQHIMARGGTRPGRGLSSPSRTANTHTAWNGHPRNVPKVIPLSSSRATWVFNPLSVSLHKRTTQARTPPPLSSRLISARFRSKAISAEAEGGRGRRRSGRRLTPGWIMDDYRGKWMDRDLAVVRRFTLRAVKFLRLASNLGYPSVFGEGIY